MRRIDRTDRPDAVWHVAGRVNWRVWYLEPEEAYDTLVRHMERALAKYSVDLLGANFMSNHYHAIVRTPAEELYRHLTGRPTGCRHFRPYPRGHPKAEVVGQCLHDFKLGVAKEIQERNGLAGHFWSGRHFRRRVVDAWALVIVLAYVHRNPVKAGMVLRAEDYPRGSAAWWATGVPFSLPLCLRPDLPFGLTIETLRAKVARLQREKRLDDVMEDFAATRLAFDSPEGRAYLERRMKEAGLDPLGEDPPAS
jgi:hypothetical protein